jgi:hypothetical protein
MNQPQRTIFYPVSGPGLADDAVLAVREGSTLDRAIRTATTWNVGEAMPFVQDDGGRATAGFKGTTGDCVVRAIAIATGKPYGEVYDALNELAKRERPRPKDHPKGKRRRSSSRTGVHRATYEKYLLGLGWTWVPTMQVGAGCTVHLHPAELPSGRLVVSLSRHVAAVIDGVLHDTYDCSRDGTRCVYGYYRAP